MGRVAAVVAAIVASASLLTAQNDVATRVSKPISFAILEDYDKGESLSEIEQDFLLFRELDIDTWRGSFGWDDYEPERGEYDFTWLRQFVALAAKHGIKLRPYLAYTPEWAARPGGQDSDIWNNPPRDPDRFARFAQAVARVLRQEPHVLSYEIYNEENVRQWWDGDAATYGRLLARASQAIRRGDRDAKILFGGLVYADADWVEAVCAVRGAATFDVLPFHAYPETWTPPNVTIENYLDGLDDFVDVADATCGRKPIWINETGFATVAGKTEAEQAEWWVRATATFLAHPRVEHVGVYEIKDLPLDKEVIGDAPNYHLGLTRTDRTKKLAFATIDLLTDLLDTGTLHVLSRHATVTLGEGRGQVSHHVFERPDGDRVVIAWSRDDARRITLTFSETRPLNAIQYSLSGAPSALGDRYDGRQLRLDLRPGAPAIVRLPR